jgi:hypothetical protein
MPFWTQVDPLDTLSGNLAKAQFRSLELALMQHITIIRKRFVLIT